ncbi:aldehyde dehydrogenase family protein [Paraburkholderia sp. RL17-347-BIC-D]|uniref:aldehyde dehydrogenase family protein n=1 Tax=Paraburkholderia sp. RL17-347-BIC-D TaxID=3031632 RepID=UPI0038B8444D
MVDGKLVPVLDAQKLAQNLSGFNLIDGALVPALSGRTFPIVNPATGLEISTAAFSVVQDVDAAVEAAQRAQPDWAGTPARRRGALVMECARLLEAHVQELSRLVTLETGKALRTESRTEAAGIADMLLFYGGLGSELKGETIPHRPDMLTITLREPIGVVGAILPWNAPMYILAMKIAPALVAGNTVVVKSAEEAPLAVLRVCQILNQVLPKGVLNIVSGYGPECGAPLVAHAAVGKITFTGSVETGKIIYRTAADKLIPVTLELGGKSPMIVMPDADLDKAAAGAVAGMRFTRQGQSCSASSRMLVHSSVHDEFVAKVKALVDAMKIGDPMDEATDIGTIISRGQYDKVSSYIAAGRATADATAVECCTLPTDPGLGGGLFVRPVMFTGLTNDSRLAREEIFGPVVCVIKFSDYEEALSLANDTSYGLTASVWTRDLKTALDASQKLQAGFVQVNQNIVAQPGLSYGGVKNSGLGKEASLEAMLDHFTQKKTVIFNMQ